jgi:hypothetical protein
MIVAAWIIAAVVSDPAAAPVEVTGSSACPSPAEVAAELQGLIGPQDPALAADRATVTEDGASVVVVLRRGSGEPVGEKPLDAGLSCAQRARAAAVIIAAWETRLGVQPTALVVEPTGSPPEAAPGPTPTVIAQPAPPPMTMPPLPGRVEIGVGAGASINGAALAPAATIEAAYVRPYARLVPTVGALFVGGHEMSVGSGSARWRRFGIAAAVGSRRSWSPLWAEGRAGIALTVLDISGRAFPQNGSGITFDPGVQLGFRGGLTVSRSQWWHWWIDATIAFWPRSQTVYVDGAPGSATLPRGEALLGLGTSFGGRR